MTSRNRSRGRDGRRLNGSGAAGEPDAPGSASADESGDSGGPGEAGGSAWPGGTGAAGEPGVPLVRVHDLAGRPRGTGFLADHHGTVVTSHEAVDGLPRLVLHGAGDRRCAVTADAVTPLPGLDLALVRTEGLCLAPLPVTARERPEPGTYVRIAADGWREARVLGTTDVTYTSTDGFHFLGDVLELAVGTAGRDALRLGGGAAGGPVLDAATGAVLGVLGTALRSGHGDVGFAVPLRPAAGPLAELIAENAATVPAYGDDLNLAGVRRLTTVSVGRCGPPGASPGPRITGTGTPEPVERAAVTGEFAAFTDSAARVLGLVGAPGSGRTTELAGLARRRARGPRPAPTLWLRGTDLAEDDGSVADAVGRALERAAGTVAAAGGGAAVGEVTPRRLAHVARDAGRPLLLLLDGPEEMPPGLDRRLAEWTEATVTWLRETGTRLVVACRAEYWERAAAQFPPELLHGTGPAAGDLPPCLRLGDLTEDEARRARARLGVPDGALTGADARHPLTLRLYAEVHAALGDAPQGRADRDEVLSAHLDLVCLRVAGRLAERTGARGTAVRRLAAKVSGRVHAAARRSLGSGPARLDPASFEELFPRGTDPDRPGDGTDWASAVLAEGLLVPAGNGYRFAHEELADWLQGAHLDLDEALRTLVHDRLGPVPPVPHHRIGTVVEALLHLARQHGAPRLAYRLEELVRALDRDPYSWWAARLLAGTLARVPDPAPYTGVLRLLADAVAARREEGRPVPGEFAPGFWTALPLPTDLRLDLLRRLIRADGPPRETGPGRPVTGEERAPRHLDAPHRPRPGTPPAPGLRHLDAVAALLDAEPGTVRPLLVRWFDDERPLPGAPRATVATAAQALLHTHRRRDLDGLVELLADSAHRRALELLVVLAEEEPAALCRAADRWSRDERPERRVAAVVYGLRAAPHATTDEDRTLLRYAALALLLRSADSSLHGAALALLVRDPSSRDRHLRRALSHFAAGDPCLPPSAVATALPTHPEPVLDAFRARLLGPDAGEALRRLVDATTPALATRVAAAVGDAVAGSPELAGHLAAYADRRLGRDPAARDVLFPLLTSLLTDGTEPVRAALATVLAGPGTDTCRPLRHELREFLLAREREPAVLDALLRAAAPGHGDDPRDLVHRTGQVMVRTPQGAARFDRVLIDLARHVPGFAARVAGWLAGAPEEWAALVGPSARRTLESLAGVGVPV
ncbi:trypsin-like peptidase domain-containing protein [Streptomyces sp. NPDC000134]|uniref:trypsin-like peptidase domain-containing protein n=1 Tax=Streptomyces sp. NPDC000134 TaxID=3364536 RepID=UPI00368BA892